MGVRRLLFCLVCPALLACLGQPLAAAAEIPIALSDVAPSRDPSPQRQAATVYCLSHPDRMAVALIALGLPVPGASPGTPGTPGPAASPGTSAPAAPSPWPTVADRAPTPAELRAWSVNNSREFDRACDALIAAQTVSRDKEKKGSSAWVSAGKILGPLLLGALLTLFTTEWRAAIDRGRKEALELRRLGREFRTAAGDYAEQRKQGDQPPPQPVHAAGHALMLRLEEVKARRAWWRTVSPVLAALTPDRLDETVLAGWTELDADERKARHTTAMDAVRRIDAQVDRTARALEHPWRPPLLRWFALWQKAPRR